MIDIGLVGLDTSHGEAFADALADRNDARLTAAWDGGTVRDGAYFEDFCAEYGATGYDDSTAMVGEVDAAMVLSVDWERHRPLATPFLEAGVPTCIDKPIAGRLDDIRALGATDTALFGGSAVPYHPAFADIPRDRSGRRLYGVGYHDPFYYGVHLADTASHFTSGEWTAVEPTDTRGELEVAFGDGSRVRLFLDGPNVEGTFGLLDASDRVRTGLANSDAASYAEMYRRYLAAFLEVVRGDDSPSHVLDGARLLLAMEAAKDHDRRITPKSDALATVEVESTEFVADYSPYY